MSDFGQASIGHAAAGGPRPPIHTFLSCLSDLDVQEWESGGESHYLTHMEGFEGWESILLMDRVPSRPHRYRDHLRFGLRATI